MIDLSTSSFVGPVLRDFQLLRLLSTDYRDFLETTNGCILFDGGLHIRGCCHEPDWHSLQRVWTGQDRLSALYPAVHADDIPFAQDVLGDQFLLRSNSVFQLNGETGELEDLKLGWQAFFEAASANPVEFLSLQLLEQFKAEGGTLAPGQLLNVYPPLFIKESANGVSLRAIPALARIRFLAYLARQIGDLPDGTEIQFVVKGPQTTEDGDDTRRMAE